MTDQMWGADVDQLDALSRDCTAAADELEASATRLAGRIAAVPWSGRDATSFRHDWQARYASALRSAGQALRAAASTVATNATEQRQASQASPGPTAGHRSTASRIVHDARAGAGWVGDAAEQVQVMADGAAAGAGAVALAGTVMPPGIDVIDFVGAGSFAVAAAGVAETAGIVSLAGHTINDPTDPKVAEQFVTEATTSGLTGPEGIDAVSGAFDGAKDIIEELMGS